MAVRAIPITDAAYRRLRANKGESESFSDVVIRLTERRPLAECAGALSEASARALRGAIEEERAHRRRLDG